MTDLSLSSKNPIAVRADALVVATAKTSDGVAIVADHLPAELVTEIEAIAPQLGITGARDEVRKVPAGPRLKADVLVLTGLGERAEDGTFDPEILRRAAGAATRELSGVASAALSLPATDDAALAAVVEGALLGAYRFDKYRTNGSDGAEEPVGSVEVLTTLARGAKAKAAVERAGVVAHAVHAARDLVNAAPNELYPATFADAARPPRRTSRA